MVSAVLFDGERKRLYSPKYHLSIPARVAAYRELSFLSATVYITRRVPVDDGY